MKMSRLAKGFAVTTMTVGVLASSISVHADILRAESGSPGSVNTAVTTLMSKYASKDQGVEMQVNSGQTLTKAALKIGLRKIDVAAVPTEVFHYLKNGAKMYKKTAKQAKSTAESSRALFGFVAGVFHPIVWADSDIKSWDDVKGKTIFLGPASGSASVKSANIVNINTGFEPNKEYKAVKMGWGAAGQAFMDGQFDVLFRPAMPGAAVVEQFGLTRGIRVLGVTEKAQASEQWKKFMSTPGFIAYDMAPDTYTGQVSDETSIKMMAYSMQTTVHKDMSEETVYKLTKAFWDNAAEIRASSATLADIKIENAFDGVIAPLHPGAYRFYKEAGVEVPSELVPQG